MPSAGTDDVWVVAFRLIDNVWMQMQGGQGSNEAKNVKIGTGLKTIKDEFDDNIDVPDHLRDGIVDANTTPKAMFSAGRYRIPPRNWDATDLWVTKEGRIGDNKHLFLLCPLGPNGQNAETGLVGLSKSLDLVQHCLVRLFDNDFLAPSNPGETTATVRIRGYTTDKAVHQTQVGQGIAGVLNLKIYPSADGNAFPKAFAETQGFSVAGIPTTWKHDSTTKLQKLVVAGIRWSGIFPYPILARLPGLDDGFDIDLGASFRNVWLSDSGYTIDLDESFVSEAFKGDAEQTGYFKGTGHQTSEGRFLAASKLGTIDTIADPRRISFEPGEWKAQAWLRAYQQFIKEVLKKKVSDRDGGHSYSDQYAIFFDKRTEMTSAQAVPVTYSGFKVSHEITIVSETNITHEVSKVPQTLNVTVGGVPAVVGPGVITSLGTVNSPITPDLEVYE